MTEEAGSGVSAGRSEGGAVALAMAFQIAASADGAQRRFTYVAPSCGALNGVSADAVLADSAALYDLILPEHQERMAAAEAQALAELVPFDIEAAFRRPDGQVRWHRITSAPRRMPDGSSLWDGIQIDVTDRKLVELELDEHRRRLELAVDATGLGFWDWDVRADALSWSDRNKALFGLAADAEVTIEGYLAAVHPEDRGQLLAAYQRARAAPDGGDFSCEHRVVLPDGQVRWLLSHGRLVADAAGPKVVVGTNLDITDRREAEERRKLVMGELAHRAKNGLSIILAIVQQTARGAPSVAAFEEAVTSRIQAMAQSQDLVTGTGGRPLHLSSLLDAVLEPFGRARFRLDEALDGVSLTGDLALGLALLVHELATNAVKYGALSVPDGRVVLQRAPGETGLAAVVWREEGGPPPAPSDKSGFGTRLIQAALRNQGGRVEGRFEPTGFTARLEFPQAL